MSLHEPTTWSAAQNELDRLKDAVAAVPAGYPRLMALRAAAEAARKFVAEGLLSAAEIHAELLALAQEHGILDDVGAEVALAVLARAMASATTNKEKLHERLEGGSSGLRPPTNDPQQGTRNSELAHFPTTDLGNAERLKERFRDQLMWCPARGWLWWDGRYWSSEGADEKVQLAAHATARAIQEEARWLKGSGFDSFVPEKKKLKSELLAGWGRASESKKNLGAMVEEAKPYLAVSPSALDADQFKINVLNGTLVVVNDSAGPRVELHPHDPRDLITKLAPVVYDPEATCPEYDAFLERVQPAAGIRRFLDQWGGLSLTGDTSEQCFTYHWGTGKNGKTTMLNAWGYVAGHYGTSIPIQTFLEGDRARAGGAPTPDLAMLAGVRYLRTSEPPRRALLGEALLKLATGSEPMQVRHLHREFFPMLPEFKISMSGNHKPRIEGTDEGIWRRVRLVPWTVQIPKEERILDFDKVKLKPEASGILNRLIAGLIDWLEHGLIVPEEVEQATADYRAESDVLGRALADCTEPDPNGRVQPTTWHRVFVAWCKANGEHEWKVKGLGTAMKARGFKQTRGSGLRSWVGFRLTRTESDFIDPKTGEPRRALPGDTGETSAGEDPDAIVPI
jgi:putative DNA primase/helicase